MHSDEQNKTYSQRVGSQDPLQGLLCESQVLLDGGQSDRTHSHTADIDEECEASREMVIISNSQWVLLVSIYTDMITNRTHPSNLPSRERIVSCPDSSVIMVQSLVIDIFAMDEVILDHTIEGNLIIVFSSKSWKENGF